MKARELLVMGIAAALFAGCSSGGGGTVAGGGGGGGGNTVADAVAKGASSVVADKISVLDSSESPPGAGKSTAKPITEFVATADWNKDKTFTYVHDRSTEVFTNVNEILCQIAQTNYVAMAGKGAYKALINQSLCKGNDSASNAGSSQQGDTSASSAPDYNTWTVNSFINNAGQLEANVWVHEKARSEQNWSEPAKVITAKLVVSKTKDEVPPYGLFRIDFRGFDELTGSVKFQGLLETVQDAAGVVQLRFADKEANGQFEEKAAVIKDSDTSGRGTVYQTGNDNGTPQTYQSNFAFDSNYFRRTNSGEDKCFDRKNFEQSAWRYGLYDFETGDRFTVKSGISYNTKEDGSGTYGWIGYWGMWSPDNGASIVGNTVYNKDQSTGVTTPYTLTTYNGKLKKHTQHSTTLGDILNIPLEGYSEPDSLNPGQMVMYRVIWDGASLVKTAKAPQNMSGPPAWEPLTTPVPLDTSNMRFGGDLNFWSQALGGQVRIPLQSCTYTPGSFGAPGTTSCSNPSSTSPVIFYTEDIVYPGDAVPTTLTCFDNCPQAPTADGMDPLGLTYSQDYTPGFAGHAYTFANMTLKDSGNAGNPALLATAPANQSWGFNSGALVDLATYQAQLDCGNNSGQICGWKGWTLPVFYTWETGPNNWNKLSIVTSGDSVVTFDPPVKVEYTHSQTVNTAADYKYNGVKFFLDYNGFGELHGIPGKCFDMATGQETMDCSGGNKRYVPEFSIATGSTVKNGTTTYYVKPLEVEQRMVKKDPGVCTAAGVTAPSAALPLPDAATDSVDPGLKGLEPPAEVKVIGGVIQTTTAKSVLRKFLGL